MADFPAREHLDRCERARAAMEELGIDGLFLTKWDNVAYFSGWRRFIDFQAAYFILPRKGEPVLIVPNDQLSIVEASCWVNDARYFGAQSLGFKDAKDVVLDTLKSLGFPEKAIGIEANPRPVRRDVWDTATGSFRKKLAIDEMMWRLRMVKSRREVDLIRRSCAITSAGYRKAFSKLAEGMTEREFGQIVYKTMVESGAVDSPLQGFLNLISGPYRCCMIDSRPSDYKFKKGDLILMDGGTTYKGYWSDMIRMACIGEPTKSQRKLFDITLEAELAGLDMFQPGTKLSEISRGMQKVIEKNGVKNWNVFGGSDWFGHSLGLEVHEHPEVATGAPDSDVVLEPGMVFAIEPNLYDKKTLNSALRKYRPGGQGVFVVEDNILITKKGAENLTSVPRELHIA